AIGEVINFKGESYKFGGFESNPNRFTVVMIILNTINFSWRNGSILNAPSARCCYGSALLPNQVITYFGGYDGTILGLNEAYLYDTNNDSWNTRPISGQIPSNRSSFANVLGLDNKRIIVFGGVSDIGYTAADALYVLDVVNFQWYRPNVSGTIPSYRGWHMANLIGKYMVISFGLGYSQTNESDILLLDISNNNEYVWTYDFVSTTSTIPTTSTNPATPTISITIPQPKTDSISIVIKIIIGIS
ncbi:5964_t:CDS:2, partial [Racocetra persica]